MTLMHQVLLILPLTFVHVYFFLFISQLFPLTNYYKVKSLLECRHVPAHPICCYQSKL